MVLAAGLCTGQLPSPELAPVDPEIGHHSAPLPVCSETARNHLHDIGGPAPRTLSWACLQGWILPLCCLDGSLRTVTPVDGRDAGTRIWWYYVDEHLEQARGCDEGHARCEESNHLHMILNVFYLSCTN